MDGRGQAGGVGLMSAAVNFFPGGPESRAGVAELSRALDGKVGMRDRDDVLLVVLVSCLPHAATPSRTCELP
jgi:hypothetical protein